jgi:bifunctional DNA-binding transcriptional regulator/antitoxin component of YhaV-PrlF toxin-antitoxin module
MYPVSITSQGQISIPASLRRFFGFDKTNRAVVYATDEGVLIKPVRDFLELSGTFKTTKKATPKQVRKAFEEYMGKMGAGVL